IGAPTFAEALRAGAEVFHHLKQLLQKNNYNTNVGDEGGFAPDISSQKEAIQFILEAITQAGYSIEKDISLGLDVASNELYQNGKYHLPGEKLSLNSDEFVNYLANLVE